MKRVAPKLHSDHRGSGVVAVLIAMLFISALGAALLFTSYTGYQVKIAARRSNENFYNAETAMSEIRAGVQRAVTESLSTAYTGVLESYSSLTGAYESGRDAAGNSIDKENAYPTLDSYLEAQFQSKFQAAFSAWQYKSGETTYTMLSLSSGSVSADTLRSFISADHQSKTTLGTGTVTLVNDTADSRLLLRGITLSYTDEKGYMTNISTDITVAYPPFSYTPAGQMLNGLNRYSLIALKGVESASSHSLSGNANVGSLTVNGSGRSLAYSGGTLVCRGDAEINNSGTFTVTSSDTSPAEFWAGSISLPAGQSSVTLGGTTYVQDDLTLDGKGSSATLSGAYYGFGSGATADKSSAILVNGRNTKLNMSGLNRLVLAGSSFIDATKAQEGSGTYKMGQSVATRSDQLAYLAPKSCLPQSISTNPCLVAAGTDYTAAAGTIFLNIKKLAETQTYYDNVSGVQSVYVNLASSGTQQVVYFFLTFDTQSASNAFFKGYFSDAKNTSGVTSYLKTYLAEYSAPASVNSAGASYSGTLAYLKLEDASAAVTSNYEGTFNSLWRTGTRSGVATAEDYYHAVVNIDKVSALNDTVQFSDGTNDVAVIADGNYTYNGGSAHIIIATGDVTVSSDFTGIIIAGGKVTMQGDITASPEYVSAALHATATLGDGSTVTVLDFLNDGSTSAVPAGDQTGISWDVDALVGYSNWKKY